VSAPSVERWRGVAAEDTEDLPSGLSVLLRARSRRLLGTLLRPHRRLLLVSALLVLILNGAAMATPYLVEVGIDRGIPPLADHGDFRPLLAIVGLMIAAELLHATMLRLFVLVTGRVGQQVLLDLRRRVFDRFQRLSLAFHERYTSGRVISRLTSDMDAIAEMLDGGIGNFVTPILSIVSIGVIIVLLDTPLGLATLAVFPLLLWLTVWFRSSSEAAYRRTRQAVALVIVHFTESLGGIRAVQAFRREPRNQEIFDGLNDRYRQANVRAARLIAIFAPAIMLLGNLTVAVVLLYGGQRVLDHRMTIGVLAAFLLYLRGFFEPMQDLSQFYNSLQSAGAAVEKLAGVLEEAPSVPEPVRPAALPMAAGAVRFSGVRFSYVPERTVIPHLDLEIPAGQTVALVGVTGAGKTTVARLIARFYDPDQGRVTLDRVDLRDLSERELRRAVVLVTQESFLFSGSVADNIAFGRPGAARAEIEAAARAIGAHNFIAALPEGYDTDVHRRGGRLSAGQRQLVAFARAFLADPAVLVLDEATSSLDVPSERQVQRALRTILADRTAVIIAHRLSTVEIADRVLVIDQGRIVEDGPPDGLVAVTGSYADLHRSWLQSLA
jgi:ATP-binding cassette subfamily B protein